MYANDNVRQLHAAVRAGNLQAVKKILARGVYVDAEDAYQVRAIHIAAELGHLNILQALIARGCNVNAQAPWTTTKCQDMEAGLSRFYSAVGNISYYIENPLSSMISSGLAVSSFISTKMGSLASPLHIAAQKGHLPVVKALVSAKADVNAANNRTQTTPLSLAVSSEYGDIARFLLQSGAVVNARDISRWTPLHHAVKKGNMNITTLLIQNKAAVNAKTHKGNTPLHLAIMERQAAVSEFLIYCGADVNARNDEGSTPLLMTAKGGHQTQTARLLILKGAVVNAKNESLKTPLYYAAENNYIDIVNLLIENDADVNVTDDRKWTPLHGAAWAGNLDIIKILIANGVEVDPLSFKQVTPLHLAADSWHVEVVKYLLAKGAEVNAPDNTNWTPLHFAAYKGSDQVRVKLHDSKLNTMKALIENGACVNAKGSNGETAVQLAAKCYDGIAVKWLIEKGAYYDPKSQSSSENSCTIS